MEILKLVFPHFSKYTIKNCLFIVFSLLLWIISMITPYLIGDYLDLLLSRKSVSVIWNTVVILAICWTLQIVLSYVRNILHTELQSKVCYSINITLLQHLMSLPLSFFNDKDSAYLNQRVSSDSSTVTAFVLNDMFGTFTTCLTLLCSGIIIFSIDSTFLCFMCLLLPLYVTIYFIFKKPLYKLNYEYSEKYGEHYSLTDRVLGNINLIKLHEWQNRLTDQINTSFDTLYNSSIKNAKIGYVFGNSDAIIRYLSNIIIFLYGGYKVLSNNMSAGEFTMLNSYSTMMITCMSGILSFSKVYRRSSVAYDRIIELLNNPKEHSGKVCVSKISKIIVDGLNFSYGEKEVISNLSFSMKKGNIYVVTGENGSGKSTLLKILCGLENNYSGCVRFNGTELKEIDHHDLRSRLISIVEQEPILFFDDIKGNIVSEKCDDAFVIECLSSMNLTNFISLLDGAMNYKISNQTTNLSGGEKQKIAIVRALIENRDILIFDEPSSALDKENVFLFIKILQQLKKDKIIIVITHDKRISAISENIISLSINKKTQLKNQIIK